MSRAGLTLQERQLPRGSTNTAKIDMSVEQRAEWCQQVAIKLVEDAIGSNYELRGTESVGPKIGDELMRSGIWAVIATMVAIAIYVWVRFEWQFAIGALIAMLHDVDLDDRHLRAVPTRLQPHGAGRGADHRWLPRSTTPS